MPPGATVYFGPVEVRGFDTPGEQVITYPHPSVRLVNGVASFLHRDALSSVRAVTGAGGGVAETAVYRPFGEQQERVLDASAAGEDKGFIGERYDADAGLQYLNARYYDPKLGLFLQPDWWEVTEPGVGRNRYSYSFNDPVNLSDPGGNAVPLAVVAIAAAIGLFSSTDPANAPGQGDRVLPSNGDRNMILGTLAVPVTGSAFAAGAARCTGSRTCRNAVKSAVVAETAVDLSQCAKGDGTACATAAVPGVPSAAVNVRITSLAREARNARNLALEYPHARVQNEVYLRTADGRIAIDPATGTGRRLDHVVIDDDRGVVVTVRETTSLTADKSRQEAHEARVRAAGGTFIRDRRTGRLLDVSNLPTRLDRLP